MTSLALTFNNVTFNPVAQNDGQIWLTSTEVAKALGYSNTKSISNLYNANKDEFSHDMTTVIEVVTNGINDSKRKIKTRIFSLRGCHLLGFFANTNLAKKFRMWALDVLDREVGKPIMTTNPTNKELYEILHAAVSSHHKLHRMTKSLAVTLHVRDTIDYQLRGLREDIIRIVKFADNQKLCNRFGQPLVSHQAKLNAWDGASWSIAVTA